MVVLKRAVTLVVAIGACIAVARTTVARAGTEAHAPRSEVEAMHQLCLDHAVYPLLSGDAEQAPVGWGSGFEDVCGAVQRRYDAWVEEEAEREADRWRAERALQDAQDLRALREFLSR